MRTSIRPTLSLLLFLLLLFLLLLLLLLLLLPLLILLHVCMSTLKVSRAPISVKCLFSMTLLRGGRPPEPGVVAQGLAVLRAFQGGDQRVGDHAGHAGRPPDAPQRHPAQVALPAAHLRARRAAPGAAAVRTDRYSSPRHHTHVEPPFITYSASYDMASTISQSLRSGSAAWTRTSRASWAAWPRTRSSRQGVDENHHSTDVECPPPPPSSSSVSSSSIPSSSFSSFSSPSARLYVHSSCSLITILFRSSALNDPSARRLLSTACGRTTWTRCRCSWTRVKRRWRSTWR